MEIKSLELSHMTRVFFLMMEKMSRIRFIWPTSCLALKNMTANTSIKLDPDMDDEMQELLPNFIKQMRPEYQG